MLSNLISPHTLISLLKKLFSKHKASKISDIPPVLMLMPYISMMGVFIATSFKEVLYITLSAYIDFKEVFLHLLFQTGLMLGDSPKALMSQ